MLSKLSVTVLLPILAFSVGADDLHVFEPGEVATASNFNNNFTTLNNRIITSTYGVENELEEIAEVAVAITNRLESLESLVTNDVEESAISYDYINSNVGDQIAILGKNYRIVKLPLFHLENQTQYSIKLPVEIEIDEYGERLNIFASMYDIDYVPQVNMSIDGYDAEFVSDFEYWSVIVNSKGIDYSSPYSSREMKLHNQSNASIRIMFDDKFFLLSVYLTESQNEIEEISLNDYDFSRHVDIASIYSNRVLAISRLDAIIDYIKVEEISL